MRTLYSPDGPPLLHEATEHRECAADTTWVPRGLVYDATDSIRATYRQLGLGAIDEADALARIHRSVRLLVDAAGEHADDGPCGWEGETVVQVLGPRRAPVAQWTCPRCGAEHEDDVVDDDEGDWWDR